MAETKESRAAYYATYGGSIFAKRQQRLEEMEGWRVKGYVPTEDSGITIGYGIDLSQIKTVDSLVEHGIARGTAEQWKKLGILGKTSAQLKANNINVNKLLLKVSIPNSSKGDVAIAISKVQDKKLKKYQGKVSDEAYITLSSNLHFSGSMGKISPDGFNDTNPFRRKNHAAANLYKILDDYIENNPNGTVPDKILYDAYVQNSKDLYDTKSPSNSTTYERDAEKFGKSVGIQPTELLVNLKKQKAEDKKKPVDVKDFDLPPLETEENLEKDIEVDFTNKWKEDLFNKVKSTINEGDGRQYSNKDLLAFSDVIDGMSYEEAKNQFGIETDEEGDGFSINIGQQTLQSQVNLAETEVKTADVKTRLQAVINDSNSTIEEVEAAKQNIIDLDSNLEGLKDRLENPILDRLIPINPNNPTAQSEQANTAFVTGESSSVIDKINSDLDAKYGEQDVDDKGVVLNVIGNKRKADGDASIKKESTEVDTPYKFDLREAKNLGLMYDEDGQTYSPEQLENMMIEPKGLMNYEQYSVWNEQQIADPNASFEEFQGLSDEDYTALLDKSSVNKETKDNETYDLLGEQGNFEESFLDKVGGLSSLIGLATGVVGLGQALKDVDIPKDPKLGPAFQQRLEESKRMAQQGLTPSELAKAHNELDSSYATGIENIVRGSAGNRAQFMAGLGGLDVARQSALMDISVADAKMQRENQEKYDGMMLMDEQYSAARQAKYQNAKFEQDSARQSAGAALGGAGISMVSNAINDRQINRFRKIQSQKMLMQMGYKPNKNNNSGQDKIGETDEGEEVQTSFTLPSNFSQSNLLDSDDTSARQKAVTKTSLNSISPNLTSSLLDDNLNLQEGVDYGELIDTDVEEEEV